jgi:DNA-binding MarR family transcriptional regulator
MGSHANKNRDSRIVLDSLRRVVRSLRISSRAAEKRVGLSGAQLFVLSQLADGGPMSVNDLADRTLTHQSSVSVVVQRLVSAGLIARKSSQKDGRRLELSLTPSGKRAIATGPDPAQNALLDALRKMPQQRRAQLAKLLSELVRSAGMSNDNPELFLEDEARKK